MLGSKRRGADRGQPFPKQGLAVGIAPQAGLVDDGEIEGLPGEVDAMAVAATHLHRLPSNACNRRSSQRLAQEGTFDADRLFVGQGLQGAEPLPMRASPSRTKGSSRSAAGSR